MDKLLLYVSKNEKITAEKNDGIIIYNAVIIPEKKETSKNIFKGDNEYILQQIIENKLIFDEIIIDNYEDILAENNNYVYAYLKCLNKNGRLTVKNLSSSSFVQFSDLYSLKEDDKNIIIEQLQNEKNINCVNIINFSYKYKALANKSCMGVNELFSEVKEQKAYITELEEQCINFDKWYKNLEKGAKSTYEELQKSQEYIKELENICKNNENEKNSQKKYIEELEHICKTNESNKIEQQKYINELENICKNNENEKNSQKKYIEELEQICKTNEANKIEQQKYINELENICKENENEKNSQKKYIEELEQICKTIETNKLQQQKYVEELESSVKNAYNQLEEKSKYINELENTCKEQEQVINDKDEYFNKMKDAHENEITQLVDENIRKIDSANKIHEEAVKKLLKIENSIWYKVFNKFYKY